MPDALCEATNKHTDNFLWSDGRTNSESYIEEAKLFRTRKNEKLLRAKILSGNGRKKKMDLSKY